MRKLLFLLAALLLPGVANAQTTPLESYINGRGAPSFPCASTLLIPATPGASANTLEAIPCNTFATLSDTQTLTNKTISAASNTLTGVGLLGSPNIWSTGGNTIPICTLSVSAGATTPNGANCTVFTLQLTQNTTINFPTGLPSSSTAYQQKLFDFQQPATGGPYSVTFATGTGYYFPAAGAQPILTTTPSAYDEIPCSIFGGASPVAKCSNNGLSNIQAAGVVALQSGWNSPTYTVGGVTSVTASVTNTGTPVGAAILISCVNSACTGQTGTAGTVTSSAGGSCTQLSGTFNNGSTNGAQGQIFLCTGVPSGATTLTGSWGGSVTAYYAALFWIPFTAPAWLSQADANIGNNGATSSSVTNGSIATSAATTLNGELIVGFCNSGGNPTISSPAIKVTSDTSGHYVVFYLLSPVTQVQTVSFTIGSSNPYTCAIGAIK